MAHSDRNQYYVASCPVERATCQRAYVSGHQRAGSEILSLAACKELNPAYGHTGELGIGSSPIGPLGGTTLIAAS
jgi:hypothetical protein